MFALPTPPVENNCTEYCTTLLSALVESYQITVRVDWLWNGGASIRCVNFNWFYFYCFGKFLNVESSHQYLPYLHVNRKPALIMIGSWNYDSRQNASLFIVRGHNFNSIFCIETKIVCHFLLSLIASTTGFNRHKYRSKSITSKHLEYTLRIDTSLPRSDTCHSVMS